MSRLNSLKNRDPREVARILSLVSSSVLPSPGIGDIINQGDDDPEFVRQVLDEIRIATRVPAGSFTPESQAKIYAYISAEISSAVTPRDKIERIKERLGNEGALRPSEYKVTFNDSYGFYPRMGITKSQAEEAVLHPDQFTNLSTTSAARPARATLSLKYIKAKRVEDCFHLLVISGRIGSVQEVNLAVRVYPTEVDLRSANTPFDVLRSFVNVYGLPFLIFNSRHFFALNEIIRLPYGKSPKLDDFKFLSPVKNPIVLIIGGNVSLSGPKGEILGEVLLSFVIDTGKYLKTLLAHHVHVDPDVIAAILKPGQ